MKHEFDCYCIKCQQEDVPERTSKLVVAAVITVLAMALTFGQRAQAAGGLPTALTEQRMG